MTRKSLSRLTAFVAAGVVTLLASTSVLAHTWEIGWLSQDDGSVDFYGVSFHDGTDGDDFLADPAGVVINGSQFAFNLGSVVDLNPGGGCSGTVLCSDAWNALGLDGSIVTDLNIGGDLYNKYAVASVSFDDLINAGLMVGLNNDVNLTAFDMNNPSWQTQTFTTGADITVAAPVPEPAFAVLMMAGLFGLALKRRIDNRHT